MSKKNHEQLKTHVPDVTNSDLPSTQIPDQTTENNPLKFVFWGSLGIMFITLILAGWNMGYHPDEIDMNVFCKANYSFYASLGKDTSFLSNADPINHIDPIMKFYGTAFEYIPVGFNKLAGLIDTRNEFNSRHFFIQLFAVIGILFAGLIGRRIKGWPVALLTIWLIFLTPCFFGGAMFNSKDVPFCSGYTATLYFIMLFLDELPSPSWKTTLLLMAAFAFTVGTRVGGLMLFFYLGIFTLVYVVRNMKTITTLPALIIPVSVKLAVVLFGGLALVVLSWPYLLLSPLDHLIDAITVVKKFPQSIQLTFDGVYTDSLHLPSIYLPKYITLTVPLFMLFAFICGICLCIIKFKQISIKNTAVVLLALFFPIVYAVVTAAPMYSQWRHFLFIYPAFCLLGGLGIDAILTSLKKMPLKIAFGALCILGITPPVYWMAKNHPYEYTYFNELSGGIKRAYYDYETDYWEVTIKNAVDWTMKNEQIAQSKDTVIIATNSPLFARYYLKTNYPGTKVKVLFSQFATRYKAPWTYAIFSKIFLSPEELENYFPGCFCVHTENLEQLPMVGVMKDTERVDLQAQKAFSNDQYALADSLLNAYTTKICPSNVGILGLYAMTKANEENYVEAIRLARLCLSYNVATFSKYDALCTLGLAFANTNKVDSSIIMLQEAIRLKPNLESAHMILQQVEALKKRMSNAAPR